MLIRGHCFLQPKHSLKRPIQKWNWFQRSISTKAMISVLIYNIISSLSTRVSLCKLKITSISKLLIDVTSKIFHRAFWKAFKPSIFWPIEMSQKLRQSKVWILCLQSLELNDTNLLPFKDDFPMSQSAKFSEETAMFWSHTNKIFILILVWSKRSDSFNQTKDEPQGANSLAFVNCLRTFFFKKCQNSKKFLIKKLELVYL